MQISWVRWLWGVIAVGVLSADRSLGAPDAAWHWEGASQRFLVRCATSGGGAEGISRPFRCNLPNVSPATAIRAWDADSGREVRVQTSVDGGVLVVPTGVIVAGTEGRYWVYSGGDLEGGQVERWWARTSLLSETVTWRSLTEHMGGS